MRHYMLLLQVGKTSVEVKMTDETNGDDSVGSSMWPSCLETCIVKKKDEF